MVTEGDIATMFINAVRSELECKNISAVMNDWYVSSQQQQFGPDELDRIPANRVFGVTANVEIDSLQLSLFWDGLEQSVISSDESNGKKICDINTSKFYSCADFKDRINSAVAAALEQTVNYIQHQ